MTIVGRDAGSPQADSPIKSAWSEGWQPFGTVLHSLDELCEHFTVNCWWFCVTLLWLCHRLDRCTFLSFTAGILKDNHEQI